MVAHWTYASKIDMTLDTIGMRRGSADGRGCSPVRKIRQQELTFPLVGHLGALGFSGVELGDPHEEGTKLRGGKSRGAVRRVVKG